MMYNYIWWRKSIAFSSWGNQEETHFSVSIPGAVFNKTYKCAGTIRLFHAPTRTASSGCPCFIIQAIRDMEQTTGTMRLNSLPTYSIW